MFSPKIFLTSTVQRGFIDSDEVCADGAPVCSGGGLSRGDGSAIKNSSENRATGPELLPSGLTYPD